MDMPNWVQIAGTQLLRLMSGAQVIVLKGRNQVAHQFETFFAESGVTVCRNANALLDPAPSAAAFIGLAGYEQPISELSIMARLLPRDVLIMVTTRTTSPYDVCEYEPYTFPSWPRFLWAAHLAGLDISEPRCKKFVGHRVLIAPKRAEHATAFNPPAELVFSAHDEHGKSLYAALDMEVLEHNWEALPI